MTLKELQPQLLALSIEEKAQAIQLLAASLTNGWIGIEKTPGVMGGDACIRQTRIPVWLLVSLRRQGASEAYLLEDYPTLTAADLVNAWLYADAHPDEIEEAIAPTSNVLENKENTLRSSQSTLAWGRSGG